MPAYDYITNNGLIIPDTSDISDEVISEYKAVFGQDLVTTANTPQGILINSETFSRSGISKNNANLANQINPNISGGIFLDALLALTGAEREKGTFSSTLCNLTGIAFTVIPEGVTAINTNNFVFASAETVTLDATGNATDVMFVSIISGPIDCPIGTLTTILDGVTGWETITNTTNAILGSDDASSDERTRLFRKQTLALQGTSLPLAIKSALNNIPSVKSNTFLENITNATAVIQGITLVAHSIWVCVDGGSNQEVATVLVDKKSAGAAYNGSVSVNITDPTSGQTYTVLFERPTIIDVLARVTIRIDQSVVDPVNSVKDAILKYANGEVESEPGFVIGASVSPFELAGAITCLYPSINVKNLEVSYASPVNYVVSELPIAIDEKASIVNSSIQVIIV